jgi:hypothetical protein
MQIKVAKADILSLLEQTLSSKGLTFTGDLLTPAATDLLPPALQRAAEIYRWAACNR